MEFNGKGNCWPDDAQRLLLQAALASDDVARRAWRAWQTSVDVERLDTGSYRLLPLLYDRLESLSATGPAVERFKGILRHTFAVNQLQIRAYKDVLDVLRQNGIPAVATPDAPVLARAYRSVGLRPHNNFGVFVRPKDVVEAHRSLAASGWTSVTQAIRTPDNAPSLCGTSLSNESGQVLGLRWRVFDDSPTHMDEMLWTQARETALFGATALTPDSADLLLYLIDEGVRWEAVPPFRWMADAALLIRRDEIDWDYFLSRCDAYGRKLPAREGLEFVRSLGLAAVPDRVGEDLRDRSVDRRQFVRHRLLTARPSSHGFGNRYRALKLVYVNETRNTSVIARPYRFVRFLADRWKLDSAQAVVRAAIAKALSTGRGPAVSAENARSRQHG